MTVERGVDPRGFALLAFGGAGPLHAAGIADELGIGRIVVPAAAGVLSALGLAAADRRADAQRTVLLRGAELADDALREAHDAVGAERGDLGDDAAALETTWEIRYAGQSYELAVRGEPDAAGLAEAFAAEHEARYGYRDDAAAVEVVTVRVRASVPGPGAGWEAEEGDAVEGPCASRSRARRSGCRRAGTGAPTPPGRCGWSGRRRERPGRHRPAGRHRRAARRMRGDGRRAHPLGALGEHQGAPRLLHRALRARRPDGHAGRAHPGAPRGDAGVRGRGARRGAPARRQLDPQRPLPGRDPPAGHHGRHAGVRG